MLAGSLAPSCPCFGELFIAALERAGGSEAVERAFREPPSDPLLIYRPDWYLHPHLRPEAEHDLTAGLSAALRGLPSESGPVWESLTPGLLRASLSNLPEERVESLLGRLLNGRRVRLEPPQGTGMEAFVFTLLEMPSEGEALELIRAIEENLRRRDVSIHHGEVFVFDKYYEPVERANLTGFFARRRIGVGGDEHRAQTLGVSRGRLVAEVTFLNREGDEENLLEFAKRAFAGSASD